MAKSSSTFFMTPAEPGTFALFRAGRLVVASTTTPLLSAASYMLSIGKPEEVTVIIKDRETRRTLMFGKIGKTLSRANGHLASC